MIDQWETASGHVIRKYRVHILIVIVALLLALTFAHPSLLITDEWVTVNQLSQLHDGHQVILNEGKYGVYENGTLHRYFENKQNILAYSLFLPVVSLPSYWLIELFGNHFIFFILYLWTFLFIALALLMNACFPEWTYLGRWRWTNGLMGLTFVVFFLNLFFYNSFPLSGRSAFTEIVAIGFTNILLFAVFAGMVYEICGTIFEDTEYALFSTLACISCSSYLFWTSFCKDHLLVAFLVTTIILLLVKTLYEKNVLLLMAAFMVSGLLAWARPELALFIAVALCVVTGYFLVYAKDVVVGGKNRLAVMVSPFCTLVGAIPFFINNYMVTNNFLVPTSTRWSSGLSYDEGLSSLNSSASAAIPHSQNSPDATGSFFQLAQAGTNINPSTLFSDLYGILFNPQNGSMGILPLIPVFLIAVFLILFLLLDHSLKFTKQERHELVILAIISLGVFFAYARGITGMNTSPGIVPDIRYLSPIYLPLTLIGLIIIRKIPAIPAQSQKIVRWMVICWIILIPLSLIIISKTFPSVGEEWVVANLLLSYGATIMVYFLVALFLIGIIGSYTLKTTTFFVPALLALICSLPLVWQVDASFVAGLYGTGMGGYAFWIPVVLKSFVLIFGSDTILLNFIW